MRTLDVVLHWVLLLFKCKLIKVNHHNIIIQVLYGNESAITKYNYPNGLNEVQKTYLSWVSSS